jgi:PhnB protein
VNPIPENYPRVSPYLYVKGAADAIGFYGKVFGAAERGGPMVSPDGKVFHAELEIGDSLIMLSDEFEEFGNRSPNTIGGTPY